MPYVPTLHYDLPRRRAGFFGGSPPGQAIEWITTTWLRFNIFLCWMLLVVLLVVGPMPSGRFSIFGMLLVSPIAAFILYVGIVLAGWIAYILPIANFLFAAARMAYLWIFCRLIVQPAPQISLPAWLRERSL
jgi:hypothetical protein